MIATLTYERNAGDKFDVLLQDSPVATLSEVLYDGILYSEENKAFVYAEVELNHVSCKLKNSIKERMRLGRGQTGLAGLASDMPGLAKDKWDDYVLVLGTLNLTTVAHNTMSIPLHTLLKSTIKSESSALPFLPYEKLKEFAVRFAQDVILKKARAVTGKLVPEREIDTRRSRGEEQKDDSILGLFSRQATPCVQTSSFANPSINEPEKQGAKDEKALFYEEMIQADPPVAGRIIISPSLGQVLLRATNLSNNFSFETPIGFQQVAKDGYLPVELLKRATPGVVKRLLVVYKDVMLKQYYGFSKETARGSPKAENNKPLPAAGEQPDKSNA